MTQRLLGSVPVRGVCPSVSSDWFPCGAWSKRHLPDGSGARVCFRNLPEPSGTFAGHGEPRGDALPFCLLGGGCPLPAAGVGALHLQQRARAGRHQLPLRVGAPGLRGRARGHDA
eukprot:9148208-Pyramimonas_sp.AAC.2